MAASRSSIDNVARTRRRLLSSAASARASDPILRLYELIVGMSRSSHATSLPMDAIRERAHSQGFSDDQLRQCLVDFDQANVWAISADGASLQIYN